MRWLGWSIVGVLAVVFGARWIAPDASMALIWANLASPYVYAPALVVGLAAALGRRWLLAGASALVVFAWVALVGWHLVPGQPTTGPALRVASANLLMVHPSPQVIRSELETFDADVLLLQEYSPRWEAELTAAGFFVEYPHHVSVVREDSFGVAILSRVPLTEAEIVDVEGLPMARARLDLHGREIEVWSVHTLPPRTLEYTEVWRAQMELLRGLAATSKVPVMMMGDFNAGPHNPSLQALGLDSAHVECGMGGATTFPNGVFPLPELRMDHALMHGELGCVALRHGVGQGSDHRPVVLDLGWR